MVARPGKGGIAALPLAASQIPGKDVLCCVGYVMCYVLRTLGLEVLVTTNDRTIILGIGLKLRMSILRSKSRNFAMN